MTEGLLMIHRALFLSLSSPYTQAHRPLSQGSILGAFAHVVPPWEAVFPDSDNSGSVQIPLL